MTYHLDTEVDLERAVKKLVRRDPRLRIYLEAIGNARVAASATRIRRTSGDHCGTAIVDR
jgi:hypothetical protein